VIAPPLILVGTMMLGGSAPSGRGRLRRTSIPRFLTLIIMPLAVSITEVSAFGGRTYAALKLATGRSRDGAPLDLRLSPSIFVLRYASSSDDGLSPQCYE
jgi:AGZA family xanthine/uracil permease-like MFS transporter